jgi:hypothetical protein
MIQGSPKPSTSVATKTSRSSVRNEATLIEATKIMRNQVTSPAMMQAQATTRDIAMPDDTTAAVKKSVAKVNAVKPMGRLSGPPMTLVTLSTRVKIPRIR